MNIINSISEYHRLLSLPEPLHPLISIIQVAETHIMETDVWEQFFINFYSVSVKTNVSAKVKYGQQYYDFNKGVMNFLAPKQIQSLSISDIRMINEECGQGYVLLFHPDFIRNHPLGQNIRQYGFFSYEINEALHLSDNEKQTVLSVFKNIEEELHHSIDDFSQDIILSHIEALLNYSNRFYRRQFITRKAVNHDLLSQTEKILNDYFDAENAGTDGLPTVEMLASKVNVSPRYLSDMLRSLTGQSAQQIIHEKLIEKAKEYLSVTSMSVSEVAYHLGFEYPQSFSKLFKKKTGFTPVEFKEGFRLN